LIFSEKLRYGTGCRRKKLPKRRAIGVFLDTHVELFKKAPARLFTLERD
jgi:hypothetical protein